MTITIEEGHAVGILAGLAAVVISVAARVWWGRRRRGADEAQPREVLWTPQPHNGGWRDPAAAAAECLARRAELLDTIQRALRHADGFAVVPGTLVLAGLCGDIVVKAWAEEHGLEVEIEDGRATFSAAQAKR